MAMRIAGTMPTPWTSSSAVMQPVRPRTEPTERSMPAVRMTSSWPTAMMPKTATWRERLARLSPVRNSSEASVSAPKRTSRTIRPPASRPKTLPKVRIRSSGSAVVPAGVAPAGAGSRVVAAPRPLSFRDGMSVSPRLCRRAVAGRVVVLCEAIACAAARQLAAVRAGARRAAARQVQHLLLRRPLRGQLARDRPLAHHEHAIGQPEHLGQVGRHDDHAEPFGGEAADDLVDLGLRPDVDALGRLVEHETLGRGRQPPREQHLLLVAARQRRHRLLPAGRAQAQATQILVDDPAFAALVDEPEARDLVEVGQRGV